MQVLRHLGVVLASVGPLVLSLVGLVPLRANRLGGSLQVRFCDDAVLRLSPDGAFNEPLVLFPKLAPGRCVLACDPFPHIIT